MGIPAKTFNTETFKSLRGRRIEPVKQTPIEIPYVGKLFYYPWSYSRPYHRIDRIECNLTSLNLQELKKSLPEKLRLPTLLEDHLIYLHASQFEWTELSDLAYGPVGFWARRTISGKKTRYDRLFFETKDYGNVELTLLTRRPHFVDTELKDLTKATKQDFEEALEMQGLDPNHYLFPDCHYDAGVIATVLTEGKRVGRTYIAHNPSALVLHKQFGTPLVSYNSVPGIKCGKPIVDLRASGFPEEFHGMEMLSGNIGTPLDFLVDESGGRYRNRIAIEYLSGHINICVPPLSYIRHFRNEQDDIMEDLSPRACNHQRGFYAVEKK